jgi:ABC-2 type transport system ATP-binding protein
VLTARENLRLIGRLYGLPKAYVRSTSGELLERFSLADAADRMVKTFSGGMRRRLDLAVSLIAAPPVLFLDEPTTGLDPRSRGDMWDVITDLVAGGTSLLLTTQYMEEAERLAHRIVVIDRGLVIARGTADELKSQVGGERLEVVVTDAARVAEARSELAAVGVGAPSVDEHTRRVTVPVSGGTAALVEALRRLDAAGIELQDVGVRRPTLDDVFLTLTGHTAESEEQPDAGDPPSDKRHSMQEVSS